METMQIPFPNRDEAEIERDKEEIKSKKQEYDR
jgi:hypothetical protein